MILFALQVTMMTFDNTTSMDNTDATPIPYNASGVVNGTATNSSATSNEVWSFLSNPTKWANSSLLIYLVAFIAAIAISGITILGSTAISSDTVRFAPLFMIVFGAGSVPIVNFWQVLQREVSAVACVPESLTCWTGWLVPFLFIAPLTVMWFFACFTWWRTGLQQS